MQITFIRHLPTDWNKKTWLQGKRDIRIAALTKNDCDEIKKNKKHLKTLAPFDLVLASTLTRTQETALLYGFEPEVDHLLDELDFGPFEGVPKKRLVEELKLQWKDTPSEIKLGEPVLHLERRIKSFFQKYKSNKNILVFGHGAWIRAALSYVKYGNINQMNKIEVKNNDCLSIYI